MRDPEMCRFLEACGADGPLDLRAAWEGSGTTYVVTFHQPFMVIGNAEGADIRLDHPDLSRCHAYMQWIDRGFFCVDLSSRLGSRWDGERRHSGWLFPGQRFEAGPLRILCGSPGADDRSSATWLPVGMPSPKSRGFHWPTTTEGTVQFLTPDLDGSEWDINCVLVLIGKAPGCRIQLPDPGVMVSNYHCSLVRTPDGIWVVDLVSRSGTFVNESRVRAVKLADGDILRVGPYRLRFRERAPATESDEPESLSLTPVASESGEVIAPMAGVEVSRLALACPPELGDSVLMPLLQEFRQMQQQMADQYQQALMMMFRMFSGMHRDQMMLVRDELRRIGELTREQQSLQSLLENPAAAKPDRPALRLVAAPSPAGQDRPASGAEELDGLRAEHPPIHAEPMRTISLPTDRDAESVHGMLVERLAAIRQERQRRWQRLIRSVIGKSAGEKIS